MGISDDDSDDCFNVREGANGVLLTLPDELAEWAEQNQGLILQVQKALTDTYETLSEDQVWEVIAAASSPEWREARDHLREAQAAWDDLNRPENTPLGLIGNALDSDETLRIRDEFSFSLAQFTVINEGLRQREDLGRLLSVLLVQKRMLDASSGRTQNTLASTASLRDAFDDVAGHEPEHTRPSVSRIFEYYATKMGVKKKETKSEPALSSPET